MRTLFASVFLVVVGSAILAGQVARIPAVPRRPPKETSVYLVTFRRDIPPSQRPAVVQASGARLRRTFVAVNAVSVEIPDTAVMARLRNDPRIVSVIEDRPISLLGLQGRGGGGGGVKPKAPTNLNATAISPSQINLAWTDNSNNETGFAIERCAGSGCSNFSEIARVGSDLTAFGDVGLTAGILYRYQVLAFNAAGTSKDSNIAEATTPQPPPTAPSNLTSSVVSSSQINVNWSDNSTNEDGFRLERCTGAAASCLDANFVQIAQTLANVTSFNDAGLQVHTKYTYRVRAFNSAGMSGYSNSVEATTLDVPPTAPSNLTSSVVSSSQINLSWSDNSTNEDGFRLERCTGAVASCLDANFTLIAQPVASATSFNDTGLQAHTKYTYRVRASNSAGMSAYSNSVEATTLDVPPAPPGNLTSSVVSSTQINLSWSDNSTNEDGFRLERCTGAAATCLNANFVQIAQTLANVASFNDTGLQAQTKYTYRVRASNSAGMSAYSNSIEATTEAAPLAAPSNLTSSVVSSTQINLTWSDNSTNEDGFQLERCTGAAATCLDANFTLIAQPVANATSFNDAGLQAHTKYTYRVRASNSTGKSAYSNSTEATTLDVPPAAPSNLTSSVVSSSQINLNWSDNSTNEDGFKLERCNLPAASCLDANFVQIAQTLPNVTSFNDTGLQAQSAYTYRVRASNSAGMSAYSNSIEATTLAAPLPPTAPTNLTTLSVSYNQVNLTWSDNSTNEGGFRLERCNLPAASCLNTNFVQIAQTLPNVTSFNNAGLQGQTTYTYRVRAFNAAGTSSYSNSLQVMTPAAPPTTQVVPAGVQRIGAAPGMLNWTGAGVGVAVVDTGLDFNHADLGLAPEIQGVNSFNAFGGSCQDFHGHGTHVGGIIAARNNSIDVVGVAPNATLYCVNVFQPDPVEGATGTDEDLIAGLNWIAQNANVVTPRIRIVNMSLGRQKTPDDDNPNHPVHLAVKALYDMGISIVVAAGNDPTLEVTQQVPAGYPEVMAVASTTAVAGVNGYDEFFAACAGVQNIKPDTASYFTTDGAFVGGTGVTVSAPGEQQEDLFSFFDSCFLESIGILSTALNGGTVELSGTSMASPHVAGVVALMWEKELSLGLSLSPEFARTQIRNGVDRIGTAPLDSPLAEYTFDGQREGIIWAPAAVGDAPPPPQDQPPVVSILSPPTGSSFAAGANVTFQGTATDPEDGNIAPSLVWTSSRDGQIGTGAGFTRSLTSGNHVITASATDSAGNTSNANTSVTVGSPSTPTKVQVSSITYAMQGTTLLYTVKVVNEFGGPIAGATVDVDLYEYIFTGNLWISSGTSNSQGNAQFQLPNADFGCYVTAVRNVTATGLTFVFGTPDNNFCLF